MPNFIDRLRFAVDRSTLNQALIELRDVPGGISNLRIVGTRLLWDFYNTQGVKQTGQLDIQQSPDDPTSTSTSTITSLRTVDALPDCSLDDPCRANDVVILNQDQELTLWEYLAENSYVRNLTRDSNKDINDIASVEASGTIRSSNLNNAFITSDNLYIYVGLHGTVHDNGNFGNFANASSNYFYIKRFSLANFALDRSYSKALFVGRLSGSYVSSFVIINGHPFLSLFVINNAINSNLYTLSGTDLVVANESKPIGSTSNTYLITRLLNVKGKLLVIGAQGSRNVYRFFSVSNNGNLVPLTGVTRLTGNDKLTDVFPEFSDGDFIYNLNGNNKSFSAYAIGNDLTTGFDRHPDRDFSIGSLIPNQTIASRSPNFINNTFYFIPKPDGSDQINNRNPRYEVNLQAIRFKAGGWQRINTNLSYPESLFSFVGEGLPPDSIGANGQLYLDSSSNKFYVKANDTWRLISSDARIIYPNDQGILRAATINDFNDNVIAVQNGNIKIADRFVLSPASDKQVSFRDFTAEADLPSGYRFRGIVGTGGDLLLLSNNQNNDIAFAESSNKFYRYDATTIVLGQAIGWVDYPDLSVKGPFPTEALAKDRVTGNGQIVYLSRDSILKTSFNFTAATAAIYQYSWQPLHEIQAIIDELNTIPAKIDTAITERQDTDFHIEVYHLNDGEPKIRSWSSLLGANTLTVLVRNVNNIPYSGDLKINIEGEQFTVSPTSLSDGINYLTFTVAQSNVNSWQSNQGSATEATISIIRGTNPLNSLLTYYLPIDSSYTSPSSGTSQTTIQTATFRVPLLTDRNDARSLSSPITIDTTKKWMLVNVKLSDGFSLGWHRFLISDWVNLTQVSVGTNDNTNNSIPFPLVTNTGQVSVVEISGFLFKGPNNTLLMGASAHSTAFTYTVRVIQE